MSFDERTLNGMSVLVAIVDCGSFAAAADVLNMSPPGVSRAVARLETRLGIRLFDRTTRSVMLTDEGRRFYEQVQPLLAGLEDAATSASEGVKTVRGRLRINIDPFFSRLLLGPQLGNFLERHPQLELDLVTRDRLGDMIGDGFDLALRFGHPKPSTLVARKLFDSRIITVAAPSYLARHGRPATPQDLEQGHVCILFREPESGRPFSWEFHRGRKKLELHLSGQLTLNDAGTLWSTCLAGYGIAQMMDIGSEGFLADGSMVDLFPDWPDERYPLYALYPSRHHVPAKTRAFLEFLMEIGAADSMATPPPAISAAVSTANPAAKTVAKSRRKM